MLCNAPRPMCQLSSSYSPSLPCHSLACCILSCHHVHCIIMFSKLASVRVSQFRPLSVLNPDTLARARGMSEILFYKWPGKCSRNEMIVGVRCCFVVSRPPVKFHRIRRSFDAPTDNYSDSIAGLSSDVSVSVVVVGPLSLLLSQPTTSSLSPPSIETTGSQSDAPKHSQNPSKP